MHSYHVYFTPKEGFNASQISEIIARFAAHEMATNAMDRYELIQFENKASFQELPDYHFTAHYRTEEDRSKAFETLAKHYTEEPHLSLMKMTKNFKVAFSKTA